MNHIIDVKPKEDYCIEVTLENGSKLTVGMKKRLNTVRFCSLTDIELFNQVSFDLHSIRWNKMIEISLNELFQMARW